MAYTDKQSHINKKGFFEGWYFKIQNRELIISFIPGVSTDKNGKKQAFIQVISNSKSDFNTYDKFDLDKKNINIKIGENEFTEKGISVNIQGKNINIKGKVTFKDFTPIKKTPLSPSIMGPFSYLSFMECYHGVESLMHQLSGYLIMNGQFIDFTNGVGYLERDYGRSFPKSYIWLQANSLKAKEMFFLSFARIPFAKLSFKGLICIFFINNKEYRFATYNGGKIKKLQQIGDKVFITVIKGHYRLEICATNNTTNHLMAPTLGKMEFFVKECVTGLVNVCLFHKNKQIHIFNSSQTCLEFHQLANLLT